MANVDLSVKALRIGKRSDFKTNDWDDLITIITALVTLVTELKADMDANNAVFDAHTHTQQDGDSGQTSKADDTAEGVANAGTDQTFTADITAATPDTPVIGN